MSDDFEDEDFWPQTARICKVCKEVIPAERLIVFPNAETCTCCQNKLDAGEPPSTDYCPRCGEILQVRCSASGITRYESYCPSCRWRGE